MDAGYCECLPVEHLDSVIFFFFKECYELNASVPQDFYIEILSSNLIIQGWGLWDVIRSWKLSLYDWALMVTISTDLGCSLRWPWTQSPPISTCWFLVLQRGPLHQKKNTQVFLVFFSGRDWTWDWCLSEWGFREPLCPVLHVRIHKRAPATWNGSCQGIESIWALILSLPASVACSSSNWLQTTQYKHMFFSVSVLNSS